MELFAKWNRWLGERMFLVTVSALFLGFVIPNDNSSALTNIAIFIFSYMTFVTALGTSLKDFCKVFTKPITPIWILVMIHIIVPIFAWVVGILLFPDDSYTRLGLLIGASIPIAVTSIIWTSITKGDVALTLVAVTLDTFVAPFWLPLYFKLIVGHLVVIDFNKMVLDLLLMVTLPSLLGMLINDLTKRKTDRFVNSIGGVTSKLALFLVVYINSALVYPAIAWNMQIIKILIVVLILVIGGYFIGYLGSFVLKEKKSEHVKSLIYSVGMRNISFGSLLAIAYFPAAVAIPIVLMMLYQQPVAAMVAQLLKMSREYSSSS